MSSKWFTNELPEQNLSRLWISYKKANKGGENVPKTNFPMPRKTYKVVKRDKLKCKIIPSHQIIHFG